MNSIGFRLKMLWYRWARIFGLWDDETTILSFLAWFFATVAIAWAVVLMLIFGAIAVWGGQSDEEKVAARPIDAEIIVILNRAQSNCYSGSLNARLDCIIKDLQEVRRTGVGAYKKTPKEEDLEKNEVGVPIRPRTQ